MRRGALIGVLLVLACLRLCFAGVLLSDEDYHLAAAFEMARGHALYRDLWYDKPPLSAIFYSLPGLSNGMLLRLLDASYILLCCALAYKLARQWWSEREGWAAALLLAFFTTFYLPSAVIPFAPDMLLVAPQLAAVYFAKRGWPMVAGLLCGLGFWINVKAVFVVAACALWGLPSLLGFAAVLAMGAAWLALAGAWPGYWQQVWVWGFSYASGSAVPHPLALAVERVGHWLGFQASLMLSWLNGIRYEVRKEQVKLAAWLMISFAAVCFGNHFAPRYFLQMLPPLVVVGARGIVLATAHRQRVVLVALTILLAVPLVRFAPRYFLMARHAPWSDVALDRDSQQAAARIRSLAQPGDTLFVWGYRPDVYVYTRLDLACQFWDSQPLTGVAADRHLVAVQPVVNAQTTSHLKTVEQARPTFFVDGLGPLNVHFKPDNFLEMRELLQGYREVARTRLSVIYRRID